MCCNVLRVLRVLQVLAAQIGTWRPQHLSSAAEG